MSAPDLDALYAEAEQEAVDTFIRQRFGVEPQADPSGMFTGGSSLAVAPAPTSEPAPPMMPTIAQGPRGAAGDDDGAMVDAYMRRYFPGSVD